MQSLIRTDHIAVFTRDVPQLLQFNTTSSSTTGLSTSLLSLCWRSKKNRMEPKQRTSQRILKKMMRRWQILRTNLFLNSDARRRTVVEFSRRFPACCSTTSSSTSSAWTRLVRSYLVSTSASSPATSRGVWRCSPPSGSTSDTSRNYTEV